MSSEGFRSTLHKKCDSPAANTSPPVVAAELVAVLPTMAVPVEVKKASAVGKTTAREANGTWTNPVSK